MIVVDVMRPASKQAAMSCETCAEIPKVVRVDDRHHRTHARKSHGQVDGVQG